MPSVWLPRSMEVSNHRLGLLYRSLQLLMVALVATILWEGRSYIKSEEPVGSVTQWLEADPKAYEAQVQEDFAKDLCRHPERYDYVYSPMWRYTGYSCVEVKRGDRFRKEGSMSVYIPLSFVETRERLRPLPPGAGAGGDCEAQGEACASGWRRRPVRGVSDASAACECIEDAYYLVVGQQAFDLHLEHYYELTMPPPVPSSRQHSGASCDTDRWWCEDREAKGELLSVFALQTEMGAERRIGEPFLSPSPIHFSVSEVLSLAGFSLDGFNNDTLGNSLRCDHPQADPAACRPDAAPYPLLRMTGAEIKVSLSYYNEQLHPRNLGLRPHRGPLCVIRLRVLPVWSSRPTTDCEHPRQISEVQSDCVSRYYYGVSITFDTQGRFGYFDLVQLLLTIGATLSYFTLPGVIVYFLAIYCLGPVSTFYKSSVVEGLRADEELCRMVCSAVSLSHSFRSVADKEGQLTHERVLAEVNEAFSGMEGVDLPVMAQLTELVCDRLGGKVGPDRGVLLPQFVQSGARTRSSATVRALFDQARRRWPFEYMFAPRSQLRSKTVSFARSEAGSFDEEALRQAVQRQKSRAVLMNINDLEGDNSAYMIVHRTNI